VCCSVVLQSVLHGVFQCAPTKDLLRIIEYAQFLQVCVAAYVAVYVAMCVAKHDAVCV